MKSYIQLVDSVVQEKFALLLNHSLQLHIIISQVVGKKWIILKERLNYFWAHYTHFAINFILLCMAQAHTTLMEI